MSYTVNFKEVETTGIEASIVADVLAGLRASEARYFWNKYKQEYVPYTLDEKPENPAHYRESISRAGHGFSLYSTQRSST